MATFYAVLAIDPSASPQDVRFAFKRRALAVHPDKGGSKEAFQQVLLAFETLSDAGARMRYDRRLVEPSREKLPRQSGSFVRKTSHTGADAGCDAEGHNQETAAPCRVGGVKRKVGFRAGSGTMEHPACGAVAAEGHHVSGAAQPRDDPGMHHGSSSVPAGSEVPRPVQVHAAPCPQERSAPLRAEPGLAAKPARPGSEDMLGAISALLQQLPALRRRQVLHAKFLQSQRLVLHFVRARNSLKFDEIIIFG